MVNGWMPNLNDLTPSVAVFDSLIAYFNDKGAEFDASNNIQFQNFIVWDHFTAGIETQSLKSNGKLQSYQMPNFYSKSLGALVSNSIIIGNL